MPPAKTKTKLNTSATTTTTTTKTAAERSAPAPKTPPGSDPKSKSKSKADPQPQPKAKANPAPPPLPHDPAFSQLWMDVWAFVAAETGSVEAACKEAGVSMAQYAAGGRADTAFDAVCRVRDEVADLKITDSLCKGAMNGDIRFQSLYFARVRGLILGDDRTERGDAFLSTTEAEAALRATLAVREATTKNEEAAKMLPPSPSPSRPEAKTSRDSARRTPT